ncbi:MAG TPA: FdtA/QdtA family cupin domain-containing protein [Burkholderiales bacterium]|nr:FdtA/QdtA family cupin domain-containing protein [Burkholderiales bacterium]
MPGKIDECRVLELPKVAESRGNLTFIEAGRHIPFEIKRVFYIYDVPTGRVRGAHAHKAQQQFLICLSGSFDVALDDGESSKVVRLNRPWKGLYIPPLIWTSQTNFDPGTICVVLASDFYDERDNIGEYSLFLSLIRQSDARTVP